MCSQTKLNQSKQVSSQQLGLFQIYLTYSESWLIVWFIISSTVILMIFHLWTTHSLESGLFSESNELVHKISLNDSFTNQTESVQTGLLSTIWSLSDIFDSQLIDCLIHNMQHNYINDIPPVNDSFFWVWPFEWISWIGSQNQSLVWFVMSRFIIGDEQHAYISEIPFVNDSFFWVRWINRTGSQNQLEWFFTNQTESVQAVL